VLNEVIKSRPVLLNRAPSLHKLSIGAFEVKLTDGKAIRLHPLVTTGFNADFDGDTMAIHLPLSEEAVNEARGLVLSINNLIIPKDGKPAINPTIDMPLGIFYATSIRKNKLGEGIAFSSVDEIEAALVNNHVELQTIIAISSNIYPHKKNVAKNKIIVTTVGRTLFNNILPEEYDLLKPIKVLDYGSDYHEAINNVTNDYIGTDLGLNKSDIGKVISGLYVKYGNIETAKVADSIKDFGFKYATQSGITFSIFDFPKYTNKYEYISAAKEKILTLEKQYKKGLLTDDERYIRVIDAWNKVKDSVVKDMEEILADPKNFEQSIIYLNKSGARGNLSQFTQMLGLRGLMSKSFNYSNK
jgi:DNA-directed RNA polymerase subunit beta'